MAVQRRAVGEPIHLVEPRQRVGRLLMGVARELRTVVDRQVQPLGLTMQQAELLVWTHRQRHATPTQLLMRFAARGNEKLLVGLSARETAELRRLLERVSENLRKMPLDTP
ncbi:MAG: hypothetical protein E6J35_11885 [Chloroflexi bacterium]|nr:MAG: hypothetical protein E6J35_11885 [Chloroflexota bacterium]